MAMNWVPKKAEMIRKVHLKVQNLEQQTEKKLAPKMEQTKERQTAMNLVPKMAAMMQMVSETHLVLMMEQMKE